MGISHNVLKQNARTYADLNYLISCVMAGVTASLRFPGKLNGDLRKLGVNLVPFPRPHFFLVSQAPLFSDGAKDATQINVKELTNQAYSARNYYSNVKPDDGKFLAASFVFRGKINSERVDKQMRDLQEKQADDFVTWIPNNIKSSIVTTPAADYEKSGTFCANTT